MLDDNEMLYKGLEWSNAQTIWVDPSSAGDDDMKAAADFPDNNNGNESSGDSYFRQPSIIQSPDNGRGWAFLRHEFTLPSTPVRKATLYATASSTKPSRQFVYRMWVNGYFVGLGPVFPVENESRVNTFDVTGLLQAGPNAMGVLAWTMRERRFWAYMEIELADGCHMAYGTGSNWKGIVGNRAYPNADSIGTQYFEAPAEDVQTQWYPFGFSEPGFDDSSWPKAVPCEQFDDLRLTPTANVGVHYLDPVATRIDDRGTLVLDFGRTCVGGISVDVESLGISESIDVCIRYGEVMDDDGDVRYHLSAFNTYQDSWHITPQTPKMETWGMRVFRYVQLVPARTQASQDAVRTASSSVRAAAIEYPFDDDAADFECSDETLNEVWRFCRNSIKALNGPMYVDSWTRERSPYEADAWLQQRSHLALDCGADAIRLGRYSVDWLIANRTWPTEWPLYLILAVHDSWMASNDESQIRRQYKALRAFLPERYVDESSGLIVKAPGEASHMDGDLIDWPPAERDGFVFGPVNTVINALSCAAYRAMADMARVVGDADDAARYTGRASALESAINTRLWDDHAQCYRDGLNAQGEPLQHGSLHANAFALAFVDVPKDRRAMVADYIHNKGMCCSPYVAAVLLEGLYRNGFGALANRMMADDNPRNLHSWHHMMSTGCGSTMEGWDVSIKGNTTYSHPWSASPAYLLEWGMLGVQPIEPGYAVFRVRPQLGDAHEARGVIPTPNGSIRVCYVREEEHVKVDLDIPSGLVARIENEQGDVIEMRSV